MDERSLAHIRSFYVHSQRKSIMLFYIRFPRTRGVRKWADITTPEDLEIGIGTHTEDTFLLLRIS